MVLCRGDIISTEDLPAGVKTASEPEILNFKNFGHGYSEKVMAFETAMLDEALKKSSGNQSKAADFLGISERHLRSRMQKIGLVNKYKNRSEK